MVPVSPKSPASLFAPTHKPGHIEGQINSHDLQALGEFYQTEQSQLRRFAVALGTTDVWLALHLSSNGEMHAGKRLGLLHYCSQTDTFSWVSLDEHPWCRQYADASGPLMEIVTLDDGEQASEASIYACTYTLNPRKSLFIKTTSPLSNMQRYCLEQQAELFKCQAESLDLQQQSQKKIQLLERTIHRIDHQLRNPLELIALYTNILSQELISSQFGDPLQHITKAVRTIRQQLALIKRYSQPSILQTEPCKLQTLFPEVVEALAPLARDQNIQVQCQGKSIEVIVDPLQFKEALTNLLTNALYFSPVGDVIHCQWQIFGEEVFIEICDKGPGFSEEALKKAFTPFYSSRPNGTGMGLVIAQNIILDHQGSLWAENLSPGGARLCIVLPRAV